VPPLVSIVSVNLNDRTGLSRTIASVARQSFTDREMVVMDGGSTDGSLELIRESAGVVTDHVSERDSGIFDAMNNGIRRVRGTYCIFLNGGDVFASDDALERFFAAGPPVEDVLYSDVVVEAADGTTHVWETPPTLTWDYFMRTTLPHPATAIRRELFERVGGYDTRFKMGADHEFFLRAIVVRGATTRRVPVPLSRFYEGGLSTRPDAYPLLREERRLAKERALSPVLRAHWDEYLAAKRGPVAHWIRNAFRPAARSLRALSRRWRGKPDSPV
jgi:glycosyltransferase involved in cell wall biosynthesis